MNFRLSLFQSHHPDLPNKALRCQRAASFNAILKAGLTATHRKGNSLHCAPNIHICLYNQSSDFNSSLLHSFFFFKGHINIWQFPD